jgi:calcineurin-like phosphoesterase family protein
MNNIFFTSDLHFGHGNIIDFSNRPFSSVEEMNEGLIKMWNDQVRPRDEVYFLGDFSMKIRPEEVNEILQRLNGRMYVVPGNHDKEFLQAIEQYGPGVVKDVLPPLCELKHNHQRYVMCHYPLFSWNRMHHKRPSVHLHGHLHTKYSVTKVPIEDSRYSKNHHAFRIDVGYDANKKLLSIEDIEEMTCYG